MFIGELWPFLMIIIFLFIGITLCREICLQKRTQEEYVPPNNINIITSQTRPLVISHLLIEPLNEEQPPPSYEQVFGT